MSPVRSSTRRPRHHTPKRKAPKLARTPASDRLVRCVLDSWVERYGLSEAEGKVLLWAFKFGVGSDSDGLARSRLASTLDITAQTVKAHVRSVLRRTGTRTLTHAFVCILREALVNACEVLASTTPTTPREPKKRASHANRSVRARP